MLEKFTRDIAIDFGTASVLVYVQGQGIVLKEPSVVAIDVSTDRVVKVGQDAMEMLGRTPDHIDALRPMKNGTISQYEVTLQMLRYFIRRACGKVWIPPRVLICVPTGITEVEGENAEVKGIFDLSGRRVENPTTGIYIVNGKKVLVK